MIIYWLLALLLAVIIARFYDSSKAVPQKRLRGRRLLDAEELQKLKMQRSPLGEDAESNGDEVE